MQQGADLGLKAAVEDLFKLDRQRGIKRAAGDYAILNSLVLLTFSVPSKAGFLVSALITGTFYASALMTTHDAIHHTLTGNRWFDEVWPRLLSYFVFWPYGLYAELHRLHHKYNGRNLDDPENPTPVASRYRDAGTWKRWLMRYRGLLRVFVYGGFGMIVRHVFLGCKLYRKDPRIRRAMQTDAAGILLAALLTSAVVVSVGVIWKYILYLLLVERIVGGVQQLRSHLEHDGLWADSEPNVVYMRLYSCRNIKAWPVVERFFNGLSFHSVHHAFPAIPYYHLAEAHRRVAAICEAKGRPLVTASGYLRTLLRLAPSSAFLRDEKAV